MTKDRKALEDLLKNALYSSFDQFLSGNVTVDTESDFVTKNRMTMLKEGEKIIDSSVKKIIKLFKERGITNIQSVGENPQSVEILNKVQEDMIEDAKRLSTTGHKKS